MEVKEGEEDDRLLASKVKEHLYVVRKIFGQTNKQTNKQMKERTNIHTNKQTNKYA
jgi:hypothetical protein